jgi:hypothetical protein
MLDDDRVLPLDTWTEGKLATLAGGIADCARSWADALQHGTPRSLPRSPGTARIYLRTVHPLLEQWSGHYDHLRPRQDHHPAGKPNPNVNSGPTET